MELILIFGFIPLAVAGSPAMKSLITTAAQFGAKFLGGLAKSPQQKEAEYALSATTNEIEKAMNINGIAFRVGFLTQNEALTNYNYLWDSLVELAHSVSSITAAQAARTISDRDYGGKFANVWRGTFRDDWILGVDSSQLDGYGGYLLPEFRWPMSPDLLKYGSEPARIDLPVNVPTPVQLEAISAPEDVLSKSTNNALKWAGIGIGAWTLLRFLR